MNADALLLSNVSDDLVTEDWMAALGDVRGNTVQTVYDDSVVALCASCGIGTCASGRLGIG